EHIRALEKRMPRARIVVTAKADKIEVRRDGVVVGEGQWGTALPVDPGVHRFEARAPGKKDWEQTVTMREAQAIDVTSPALEESARVVVPPAQAVVPAAQPAVPAQTVVPPPAAPPEAPTSNAQPARDEASSSSNGLRPWAFAAGGVGLASAAIGAAF